LHRSQAALRNFFVATKHTSGGGVPFHEFSQKD